MKAYWPILAFVFFCGLVGPAHADRNAAAANNAGVTFFPPSNEAACSNDTALMFDGSNPVRCARVSSGWVNVPLTATDFFNTNCEYRYRTKNRWILSLPGVSEAVTPKAIEGTIPVTFVYPQVLGVVDRDNSLMLLYHNKRDEFSKLYTSSGQLFPLNQVDPVTGQKMLTVEALEQRCN